MNALRSVTLAGLAAMVLTAALPPRFSFVIKREVTRVPFLHLLLPHAATLAGARPVDNRRRTRL